MACTFLLNSMIRGYYEYHLIWSSPVAGEELTCHHELGNSHDPYAVAVKKVVGAEEGHIPRLISSICSLSIRRRGTIYLL